MKKFENFIKSQIVPTLPQVLPSWGKQSEQETANMVNENSIREHFEESALSRGLVVRRVFGDEAESEGLQSGDYLFQETRVAWEWFQLAWETSRAKLVVELPTSFVTARALLEAQGIKTK